MLGPSDPGHLEASPGGEEGGEGRRGSSDLIRPNRFGPARFTWPSQNVQSRPVWARPVLQANVLAEVGRRVRPRRVGGPKFRGFPPLPLHFRSVLPSLGESSRGVLVVFEALGPSSVHIGSSRAVLWRRVHGGSRRGGPGEGQKKQV